MESPQSETPGEKFVNGRKQI